MRQYNKSEILTRLYGLTAEDRTRLLLNKGMTEEELLRLLEHGSMYITEEELYISEITDLQSLLLMYVPPVLLVLGIIGNVLSFIILRHRMMTKQSTYLYLAALTVADTLVLFVGPLRVWVSQFTDLDIKDQSNELCKLVVFMGYTTSDISVWLIIAVTIERYIVVCHPLHANTMCNIPRAKKVILTLVVCLSAINLHFFWTVELSKNPRKNSQSDVGNNSLFCDGGEEFSYLVGGLWPWVDAFLYSFLPFFIITILNCVIIRRVTQAYKSRCLMQKRQTLITDSRSAYRTSSCIEPNIKMTAMLLTVSFAFLLTTLPMNICLIVSALWHMKKDPVSVARFTLAETITTLLMYTNHSMNFFLYCAAGQKFRHQLLKLVCAKSVYHLTLSEATQQSLKVISPHFRRKRSFGENGETKLSDVKTTYV
ncbi:probable G-protein coupled receptor 139 [Liolophura sinensis]|uniref:probable G-protein coupled receptor 139 n=1 Tax=Liolophura sinensis TaxID=3198878 RepID=UPI0031598DE5